MCCITTKTIYTCLINQGVNSNCNTVAAAILIDLDMLLDDIVCLLSKIAMYGLLYILTYSL